MRQLLISRHSTPDHRHNCLHRALVGGYLDLKAMMEGLTTIGYMLVLDPLGSGETRC